MASGFSSDFAFVTRSLLRKLSSDPKEPKPPPSKPSSSLHRGEQGSSSSHEQPIVKRGRKKAQKPAAVNDQNSANPVIKEEQKPEQQQQQRQLQQKEASTSPVSPPERHGLIKVEQEPVEAAAAVTGGQSGPQEKPYVEAPPQPSGLDLILQAEEVTHTQEHEVEGGAVQNRPGWQPGANLENSHLNPLPQPPQDPVKLVKEGGDMSIPLSMLVLMQVAAGQFESSGADKQRTAKRKLEDTETANPPGGNSQSKKPKHQEPQKEKKKRGRQPGSSGSQRTGDVLKAGPFELTPKFREQGEPFQLGHGCFSLLGDKWYYCHVVAVKPACVKIKYHENQGFSDEWVSVTSPRLRDLDKSDLILRREPHSYYQAKSVPKGVETMATQLLSTKTLLGYLVWFYFRSENTWAPGIVSQASPKQQNVKVLSLATKGQFTVAKEDVVRYSEGLEQAKQARESATDIAKFEELLREANQLQENSLFGRAFQPDHILVKPPQEASFETFAAQGFNDPFVVQDAQAIGLTLPPKEEMTVPKIVEALGVNFRIPVIDVEKQVTLSDQWTLFEWREYFAKPPEAREKVFNVISLEITNTPLEKKIQRPAVVRQLDLVDKVWPAGLKKEDFFPKTQLFCLMSAAKSFTDFHIDFGGTSVFYTIVSGEKVFYLVPPTKTNLQLYEHFVANGGEEESQTDPGRFADMVPFQERFILKLRAGDTLFIPSGWIHAVYTPVDSVVIGGNFLHSLSLERQIQVHLIEKRTVALPQFRFPFFEMVMFYMGEFYSKLTEEEFNALPQCEKEGVEPLQSFLWDIVQGFARSEWTERLLGVTAPFSYAKSQEILRKLRELVGQLGKKPAQPL